MARSGNPGGMRKDGEPKHFTSIKEKIAIYEELKSLIEPFPQKEGFWRYRLDLTEPQVVDLIAEKIPGITIKNVENLRKELFGPLQRRPQPKPGDVEQRLDDLSQRLELALLEIEALKRSNVSIIQELNGRGKSSLNQGDVLRA